MIDNGDVDESSYDRNDSKVFCLPSISKIVLDDATIETNGPSNHDSLNFADLMNMKAPDGVDFHASYDQVPKAKVKITKKLKLKKDAHNSCPSLGYNNESQVIVKKKSKFEQPKRTKSMKQSESGAISRSGPSRSISFTTSPPCHLDVEVPTPILPKRTKSMPLGCNFGISSEIENNDGSRLSISAGSAFVVNGHNSSFTSTEKWMKDAPDMSMSHLCRPLQQAFTIMPSESGSFMATQVSPRVGQNSTTFLESTQSPRTPLRRISKIVKHVNREARSPGPIMQKGGSKPYTVESPLGRSGSWDDLGIAIFKSPIKCEVSRRTLSRRKSSKTTMESPTVSRRATVTSAEPRLLSPKRGHSPRRSSKRSSFLDRSKSVNGRGSALTANPQKTGDSTTTQPLVPRRTKSLYAPTTISNNSNKKPSPSSSRHNRAPLILPSRHQLGGRPLHDDVSVSASEAVPISSLVFAKNFPDKTHLKKAFKDTLDLVGKWKRKSEQESRDMSNPVQADEVIGSLASVVCVDSSRRQDRHRWDHTMTRSSKQNVARKSWENATTTTVTTPTNSSSRSRSEKSHSSRQKERRKSDQASVVKDSLADALEEREARLEMYLMKTPQVERTKVDRYWIEAFKRNYAKRNDLLLDVDK